MTTEGRSPGLGKAARTEGVTMSTDMQWVDKYECV